MTIFTQLPLRRRIMVLVAGGLGATLVVVALAGSGVIAQTTDRVLQERMVMARLTAGILDERLLAAIERLDAMASAAPWEGAGDLSVETIHTLELAAARPGLWSGFMLTDLSGRVRWPPGRPGIVDVPSAVTEGGPFISGLIRMAPSGEPVALMWVPVRGVGGAVTGGLAGVIDLRSDALIDLIRPLALGRTGHAVIVDADGVVLAGTETHELFTRGDHPDFFGTLIREHRADVARTPEIEDGEPKEYHIMAFVPLTAGTWGLSFGQAEWEVFLHEHHLRWRLILLGILVLGVGLTAAWWDAGVIARPLRHLTTSARAIAAGDLESPVRPESGYELGLLARTMESMRSSLARSKEQAQQLAVFQERERIARDLHDSIIQSLYGVSLGLEHVQGLVRSRPAQAVARLDHAITALTDVIHGIRSYVMGLHPPSESEPLEEALARIVHEFRLNTLLPVEFHANGPLPDLPAERRLHLQLLLREALANAARHAGASRVRVDLVTAADLLHLTIADDGRGFDPAAVEAIGLGLRTMSGRAAQLGGMCTVHSTPGGGTRVEARIPVGAGREAAT